MTPHDDWLWDGRGTPDPEMARLRDTLAPLAWSPATTSTARATRAPRNWRRPVRLALAACLTGVVAVGAWWQYRLRWPDGAGWAVVATTGDVQGADQTGNATWSVGQELVTGADGRARIRVARIGVLDVAPGSRLRLEETHSGRHRIALQQGEVRARVWAPPYRFGMTLSQSELWDLGCEFTLRADAQGNGELIVHSGWVQFNEGATETLVPQGARVRLANGAPSGIPHDLGASAEFIAALRDVEAQAATMPVSDARILRLIRASRAQDAISLVSLAQHHPRLVAGPLHDRIRALLPGARDVARNAAASGAPGALDPWWDALPYPRSKQWWWHWRDALPDAQVPGDTR